MSPTDNRPHSRVEARANAVRRRLVDRLDELHQRRKRLLDPADEIRRHPTAAVVVGAGVALVAGVVVVTLAEAIVARARRGERGVWATWRQVIAHPELLVRPQRSLLSTVVEKSITATIGACIAAAAKAYAPRLVAPSIPVLPHDVGEGAAVVAERRFE